MTYEQLMKLRKRKNIDVRRDRLGRQKFDCYETVSLTNRNMATKQEAEGN